MHVHAACWDGCAAAPALRVPAPSCARASSSPLSFAAVVARAAALPSGPAARAVVGSVVGSSQVRCPRGKSGTKGGVSRTVRR